MPIRAAVTNANGQMKYLDLNMLKIKKTIVRLRMWYADIRGHHGKRWDYEPGDWYMGRHKLKHDKKAR